ncbi:MAG: sulfatase-like hydrolase/transferase [Actinomycetota bacterium]|nr:sulfatase-like hydrolase/transferase [Actinomycetota bacterium]
MNNDNNGVPDVGLSRRRMLQLLGATAGAAALSTAGASQASAVDSLLPFTPRGRITRRPNFLVIVVDEMRYAPIYESAELKAWRRTNLRNINSISENGMSFENHHIMAAACAPSRASIFTGQYPSLHGVSQTSGAAKSAIEEDLFWLDPTGVPTMGHYFRAAGYETYYKGKWHVSDADLYEPGSYDAVATYDSNGTPLPDMEDIYLEANRLAPYGFDGWVGPEPHGKNPLNSASSAGPNGTGRDEVYARQGADQLARLRTANRPWLLVTSFVDPHDITLWGDLTLASPAYYLAKQLEGSTVPERLFDDRYRVSSTEDLSTKPSAQSSYREVYQQAFQRSQNNEAYRRFYYQLQANVDKHVGKVMDALESSDPRTRRDTVVIFLSDHGELLGSHGGLFQKWHQAYDEVLRVPFVIKNPALFPGARTTDALTSHADLLPTMLGMAGVDLRAVQRRLRKTHTEVRDFTGRDLTPFLLGEVEASRYNTPQYFMTDDEPTRGSDQVAFNGEMFYAVAQPNHVETVIARLPTGAGGALEQWKYSRYFDNPDFWSSPGKQDVTAHIDGKMTDAGTHRAEITVKKSPVEDQIEIYNVSQDPTELNNLAGKPAHAATATVLAGLLIAQRREKRLEPARQPRLSLPLGGIGV